MKKKVVVGAALMMMPLVSFAGGYLTNTNQHAAFLRSLSRGAAIDIDGALSNPAGLSFLPTDGFRVGVSIQSAFQTRDIDASFGTYNGFDPVNKVPTVSDVPYKKYYKGKAAAPVIPSVFAAYKKGDWTISGFFAITGGGGKASFDDGLPMFESAAMAGIFQESLGKYIKTGGKSPIVTPDMYTINSAMDGKQYIYSLQLGLSYKITDWLSAFAGGRMNYFSGNYDGYLDAKLKKDFGGTDLMNLALDCDQTGWGLTPVLGVDVKYGKFNFGAKYEFKTNLNIENNTKKLDYPDSAEDLVGPYELHDFYLYYMLRAGFTPDKIYRLACLTFEGIYDKETILKWLKTFYRRFFAQQFKRSCLPDGPKVGSVALSPRGDLRMPSDASARIWQDVLEKIEI